MGPAAFGKTCSYFQHRQASIWLLFVYTQSRKIETIDWWTSELAYDPKIEFKIFFHITSKMLGRSVAVKRYVEKIAKERSYRFKKSCLGDNFYSEEDLRTACVIAQQYNENVGNPTKLIIPSVAMREFRSNDSWITHSAQWLSSLQGALVLATATLTNVRQQNSDANRSTRPPDDSLACKICLREEKQVACLPCGHLCLCKSCQPPHGCCPLCYEPVESRVRVYI